ncbi:DedA family protein [Lichenihabitans psoromatis]|uniref:DedA family protein n=1 Tax=Lichenihabitans psoromatis TaxID=2528642 RepID=UPI001036E361|nr:DedA family protein [Lichenihabitans psoromatis]
MHLISAAGLENAILHFGYAAVFLVIALESAGLPLPGEATLISAAIYAAATHALSLPLIIMAATGGAIIGDNIGFWVGHRFGFELLLRYGKHIGLGEPQLKLGQYVFAKYGGTIVFVGRFVAVLRAFAAVLAGANRYPWGKFLLFNAAGALIWATVYGCAAFWFGRSIHRFMGPVGLGLGLLALVAMVVGWRIVKQQQAALQLEAERAYPGPLSAHV